MKTKEKYDEMKQITNLSTGTSTNIYDGLDYPLLIDTLIYVDKIELIYRQNLNITYTGSLLPDPKIFKRIYSCKDGKWNISEEIEGIYVGPQDEGYEFI